MFDTLYLAKKIKILCSSVISLPNFPTNLTGIKDVTKSVDDGIHLSTFNFFLGLKEKLRKNKAKQNPCSTIHTTELSKWPGMEGPFSILICRQVCLTGRENG